MSRYFRAEIRENLSLNDNHNLLTLHNIDDMHEPLPGQFYMVEVNKGYDPLLKRAFSLFRRIPGGIQIMYRIQGRGTGLLREMKAGSIINLLGPLGRGYPVNDEVKTPVVIAGGIGIASVYSAIESFSGRAIVIYGARTKDELFMTDRLKEISSELHICTDDGSYAKKGNVVDLLKNLTLPSVPVIYACGPRPMLKAVSEFAGANEYKAFLSLEEHMACGIGACLGCVVKAKDKDDQPKYQRVCKEGPVFESVKIIW